jgi:hypothetical protein
MNNKKKIKSLLREITSLEGVLPGSISKVYNVCGKKKCRCKDKRNPQKHGPYNLLSYTIAKKSSTKFIKDEDLSSTLDMQQNFRRLREIIQELSLTYMEFVKNEGVNEAREFASSISIDFNTDNCLSEKRLIHKTHELTKQVNSWREKAKNKTFDINAMKARIKQLEESRDYWKERALIYEVNDSNKKKKKISRK